MRLILQRVSRGDVIVNGGEPRSIGEGLVILLGITGTDTEAVSRFMAEKAVNLRIFNDKDGNLNRSLLDIRGDCLVVSNFTLYANSRKGRRPSFTDAGHPDMSRPLYEHFVQTVKESGVHTVQTGEFGAKMQVELVNDGPVTILLDSAEILPTSRQ